jgi:meiotic recombination protein SPO11
VKLFSKQEESDAVLDDVATMVGCTRTSLNVVASEKGVVVGRITFLEDGDYIDCTKMGVGGKAIPALVRVARLPIFFFFFKTARHQPRLLYCRYTK